MPKMEKPAGSPFCFKSDEGVEYKLTLKQKLYAEAYISNRGNGVVAVKTAGYNAKKYHTRNAISIENLQKPSILAYMRTLLRDMGLTNESVDKELLWTIQQNANLSAKVAGIREYNSMEGRHAPEKHQHEITSIEVVKYGDIKDKD